MKMKVLISFSSRNPGGTAPFRDENDSRSAVHPVAVDFSALRRCGDRFGSGRTRFRGRLGHVLARLLPRAAAANRRTVAARQRAEKRSWFRALARSRGREA